MHIPTCESCEVDILRFDEALSRSLAQSDVGYDLTLINGLTMRFLLWLGDDEFPPNAQILFSDNFRYAFTAEDMANIGDIVIGRMKRVATDLQKK